MRISFKIGMQCRALCNISEMRVMNFIEVLEMTPTPKLTSPMVPVWLFMVIWRIIHKSDSLRFYWETTVYNQLRPTINCQYHLFYITMSFIDHLWDLPQEQHSFAFSHLYFQPQQEIGEHPFAESELHCKNMQESMDLHLQTTNHQNESQPEVKEPIDLSIRKFTLIKTDPKVCFNQQKKRKNKAIKPSPYHNYQKHLNTALRFLLSFPTLQGDAPNYVLIAQRLWDIFLRSENSTKKILSFIFNQFNQYRMKPNELKDFGFHEVYGSCCEEELAEAKTFLTKMAIEQLNQENINDYLETRRIKHPEKFKKYLELFHEELEDGFLKKRFTNRSRKEQMKREKIRSQ